MLNPFTLLSALARSVGRGATRHGDLFGIVNAIKETEREKKRGG